MPYITTKVQALKSYATYQLYASANSKTADTGGVFRICILETLRWIRSRLSDHKIIPQELDSPISIHHFLELFPLLLSFLQLFEASDSPCFLSTSYL